MTAWTGWEAQLLAALAAPDTSANVSFLDTWHSFEESGAENNPLNTTEPWPLATDFNSDGVKNYPSHAAGIAATKATLTNGDYPTIVAALESGNPQPYEARPALAAELRVWGSGTFADSLALGSATPSPGQTSGTALPALGLRGYADARNSIGHHLPTQLERSRKTGEATLRLLARKPRVGG